MIVVSEKKSTIRHLNRTHLQQMLSYAKDRERDGWYYGNPKQFVKRHEEIVSWLQDALEKIK